jgi:hypothetical protein
MSMKNSSDIGNRTRDLSASSAIPQPTSPLRVPSCLETKLKFVEQLKGPLEPHWFGKVHLVSSWLCLVFATIRLCLAYKLVNYIYDNEKAKQSEVRGTNTGQVGGRSGTGTGFSPSTSVFPCQFHYTCAPLLEKGQQIIIIIVTFITGLHNKLQGCSASVASPAGPFTNKKKVHTKMANTLLLKNNCNWRFSTNTKY